MRKSNPLGPTIDRAPTKADMLPWCKTNFSMTHTTRNEIVGGYKKNDLRLEKANSWFSSAL